MTAGKQRATVVLYISGYAAFTGCAKAALLLSQLHFWQCTMSGWFYKTQRQLEFETGLTRTETETARRTLVSLDLIEHRPFGIPRRSHYRVNLDKVIVAWMHATGMVEKDHPHYERSRKLRKGKLRSSPQDSCTLLY
jgi:hypothetical protein